MKSTKIEWIDSDAAPDWRKGARFRHRTIECEVCTPLRDGLTRTPHVRLGIADVADTFLTPDEAEALGRRMIAVARYLRGRTP